MSERQLNIRVNLDTGQIERSKEDITSFLSQIGIEAEKQGRMMTKSMLAAADVISSSFAGIDAKDSLGRLNQTLRDQALTSSRLSAELDTLRQSAMAAFAAGDRQALEDATEAIADRTRRLAELNAETQIYAQTRSALEQSVGIPGPQATSGGGDMFFDTQQAYEAAGQLRDRIAELQAQLVTLDESSPEFADLQSSLALARGNLDALELKARQAASALGADLGGRASEASEKMYQLNAAVDEQQKVVDTLAAALGKASGNLEALRDSSNTDEIDKATASYERLSAQLSGAQAHLLDLQAQQADAQSAFGQLSGEIENHNSVLVRLCGGQQKFQELMNRMPGPVQSVITGIQGMTGAARAFIATPLGAVIGALVLVFKTLWEWLNSNAEAQKILAYITGYFSGILGQLKEVVFKVGKALYKAFTDPKDAVTRLWRLIKENFLNRIKAAGDMMRHFGGLLKAALTFDGDAIQQEFKKLTDSFLQFGTGVENLREKVLDYVSGVHEAAKATAELSREEQQLHADRSAWQVEQARMDGRIAELRNKAMSGDAKASAEAQRLIKEKYEKELEFRKKQANIITHRNSLTSSTQADLDAENSAWADVERTKAEQESALRFFNRKDHSMSRQAESMEKQAVAVANAYSNASMKLADIMTEEEKKAQKRERDMELRRWESRIDAMEEGEEKVLEKMELGFRKEEAALEDEERQARDQEIKRQQELHKARENQKKAKDKKYVIREWDSTLIDNEELDKISAHYEALREDLVRKELHLRTERKKEEAASMDAYLKEFGNYQEKRLAIAREYARKIEEATTQGERLALIQQGRQEIAKLDLEQVSERGPLAAAFDKIEQLSKKRIGTLIAGLKDYRQIAIKTFTPDQLKEYDKALKDLILRQSQMKGGVKKWLLGSLRPDRDEEREELQALRDLNLSKIQAAEQEISDIQHFVGPLTEKEAADNELRIRELTEALETLRDEQQQLDEQWEQTQTPGAKLEAFIQSATSALAVISKLSGIFAGLGEALGNEGLAEALDLAAESLNGVVNIAQGFAQGGLIGGIVAVAGTAVSLMSKIFRNSDRKHEERIRNMQKRVDRLQRSYEALGRAVDDAFSTDAARLIEQQEQNLRRQQELLRAQIEEEMEKKKTDDDKIEDYKKRIADLTVQIDELGRKAEDAIFGADIKSQIENFADAYADAWTQGESRVMTARDTVREMMQEMVRESLKAAIQSSGAMAEIRRKLLDYFRDGVFSAYEREQVYSMAAELQQHLDTVMGENKDLFYQDSFSQSVSSKTWGSMTSEDAGVLQGRFTALCETGESIRMINAGIAESVRAAVEQSRAGTDLLRESLDIQIVSMGYLETISKHTGTLASIRSYLEKIERYVRDI